MHHGYGDTAIKGWIKTPNLDTSTSQGLWKSPSWGGPQYEFQETWVRGLGLVEMKYKPNMITASGIPFFNTANLPPNPCNPNYEDYHLSLITLGSDTLYDASKVVVPNLPQTLPGIQSQGGIVQIPNAWLKPQAEIQVAWLSAQGQSQALPWTWNKEHLSIPLNPRPSPGWIRISQGKNWRVYRVQTRD